MEPHQLRVVDEKKQLDEKLVKLEAFIMSSPIYKGLQSTERALLNEQYNVMSHYSRILSDRIGLFGQTQDAK